MIIIKDMSGEEQKGEIIRSAIPSVPILATPDDSRQKTCFRICTAQPPIRISPAKTDRFKALSGILASLTPRIEGIHWIKPKNCKS
ncbi:hypothetical protein JW926_15345 [Candidatus Sumerlaeota bacterium]|nr:hypothetical protein [Candidatus Sumerlaeota bacterium]